MKIKMRKLFAILAITMLLLTLLPATAFASTAVTGVAGTVHATTQTPTVTFTTGVGGALVTPQSIQIVFADPVTVPAADAPIATGQITVNGVPTLATAAVITATRTVTIPIPAPIPAGTTVTVRFLVGAGLGGFSAVAGTPHAITVATATQTVPAAGVITVTGPVTGVEGTVVTGTQTPTFRFTTGVGGALAAGQNIIVTFPAGVTVPAADITPGNIRVHGTPTNADSITAAQVVTIPIPAAIPAGTTVAVEFLVGAGLGGFSAVVGFVHGILVETTMQPVGLGGIVTVAVAPPAPPVPLGVPYSATASIVEVDRTSQPVGQDIRFTLTMRNAAGALITSQVVNAITLQSTMDTLGGRFITPAPAPGTITGGQLSFREALPAPAREGTAFAGLTTNAAGQIVFNLTSAVAGTTTVNIFTLPAVGDRVLIGSATVTFTAGAATGVAISRIDTQPAGAVVVGREVQFRAAVSAAGGNPVANATVHFEEQEGVGAAWRTIGTAVTSAIGVATFRYSRTNSSAGVLVNYRARVDGVVGGNLVPAFTWDASGALTMTGPANTNVARNQPVNMDTWVNDAHGNRLGAQNVEFALTRPAGSATTFTVGVGAGTTTTTVATSTAADIFGRARATFTPDVAGAYTVRATVVGTGITVTTVYTAVDMGAVTRLELRLPGDRIALMTRPVTRTIADVTTPTPAGTATWADVAVWAFDAAGVGRRITDAEFVGSSSNPTLATAVATAPNALRVSNLPGTARGYITATATHTATGQVASIRVPIVGPVAGIRETATVDGMNASVALQFVDVDANPTFAAFGAVDALALDIMGNVAFSVSAPAGVTVGATTPFARGTGRGSLALTAAAPGQYSITVATTTAPFVSRTFTVNFAAPAPPAPPVIGAQNVAMFIGVRNFVQDGVGKTLDAAPFIENQRTFVPVRFLAEAFGATADWVPKDAPVRTVTLTRADVTVTINIGSPAITVVRNGVTSTVTADVAAFIRDRRTFLPFRAIAEAFGAEVSFGPKDAPIEWVSFRQ